MAEIKEITMDELKSLIKDSISEYGLDEKAITSLKSLPAAVKTAAEEKLEKYEKAADFIKKLASNEIKAISTNPSSFGHTVPTELADAILEKKDKIAKIRKIAFAFKHEGNWQLPTEGDGVTAYWVGENEEITESSPTIGKKELGDNYLSTRIVAPRKLLATSAYNIVEYVSRLAARALRNTEESAFISGDGIGKPEGIRNAAGIGSISQAGASLSYDDIVDLYYSLPEQYREEAVFLTSPAGVKLIRKLKDANNLPIFDVRDNTIFGKPLLESTDIPEDINGDETEIWIGNFGYYMIKDGEMVADTDKIISKLQVELVFAQAIDGKIVLPDGFKKLTGVK